MILMHRIRVKRKEVHQSVAVGGVRRPDSRSTIPGCIPLFSGISAGQRYLA